jgi:hypothetical protein
VIILITNFPAILCGIIMFITKIIPALINIFCPKSSNFQNIIYNDNDNMGKFLRKYEEYE